MGATMEATLLLEALNRGIGRRQIDPDQLLSHTDQERQYRATAYWQLLDGKSPSRSTVTTSASIVNSMNG
jgi:putative transposase